MFGQQDVQENKVYGVLAYIGILFLVGLIVKKDSAYVKFHVNQGIVLFLASILSGLVSLIPIVGWILSTIISITVFVFAVMGIVCACKGDKKPLPIIGGIILIQ